MRNESLALVCVMCSLSARASAAVWEGLGPEGGPIPALAVAPSQPDIIYAGNTFVYRSSDSGAHWSRTADVFPVAGPAALPPVVRSITVSPADPDRAVVASPQGLFLTRDGGAAWTRAGAINGDVVCTAFSTDGRHIIASTGTTVYHSLTAGDTWVSTTASAFSALTRDPASAAGFVGIRTAPDAAGRCVYRSDDGTNWRPASSLAGFTLSAVECSPSGDAFYVSSADAAGGVWRIARDGTTSLIYSEPVATLGMSQAGTACLLLATLLVSPPAKRTFDDGTTWEALSTGFGARGALTLTVGADLTAICGTERGGVMTYDPDKAWRKRNTGLKAACVSSVAQIADPAGTLLAAAGDGLYRSIDDGTTWALCHQSGQRSVMGVSRAKTGRVWHTGSNGIERSDDCGRMWRSFTTGLSTSTDVASLVAHPVQAGTVFMMTRGGAVYENTTEIALWTQRLAPWPSPPAVVPSLVVSPARSSTVYTVRPDGLYRSDDTGSIWKRVADCPADAILCADTTSEDVLYRASTSGTVVTLARSRDGGATWTTIHQETGSSGSGFAPTFLLQDPRQTRRLLLGTNRGVRISDDAGATWRIESCGAAGTFAAGWAAYGEMGDLLATEGSGVLRGMPSSTTAALVTDAVRILGIAIAGGTPSPDDLAYGDLNQDGRITPGDAAIALGAAVGL